jgi:hypothetical protein
MNQTRTLSRLILCRPRQHELMASGIQHIEKGPQVDLGPSIVVRLHDAYTLDEGERSGEQKEGSHFDQVNVIEGKESE